MDCDVMKKRIFFAYSPNEQPCIEHNMCRYICVAALPSSPPRKAATHLNTHSLYSAQTLQVKVILRLVPEVAESEECGLPMCIVAGLELRTHLQNVLTKNAEYFEDFRTLIEITNGDSKLSTGS